MRIPTLYRLALIAVLGFWFGAATAELLPRDAIESTTIVLPGQSPGPEDDTQVDIYFPDRSAQFPMAVFLQGGLVAAGSYSEFGSELARHGYLVAIPNRLSLLGPPPPVPFPDQIVVLELLAQLAVENASPASILNGRVDTGRMGILGHSVGGFVGLLTIEGSCTPPFCFPPFPFTTPDALRAGVFYGTDSVDPSSGQLIDVDTGDMPVALISGSLDSISTPADVQATFDVLDGPGELITIDGVNHFGIANANNPPGSQPDPSAPTISQEMSIEQISRASGEFLNEQILNLAVSKSRYRSNSVPLQGSSVAGNVYIFLSPVQPQHDIDEVDFYLDDSFVKTEFFAPYDFQGTYGNRAARFDTNSLANGSHTVRAEIYFQSGEIQTESATFDVANEMFMLSVSDSPQRTGAVPLAGQTLSGDTFIFITPVFPETQVATVDFFLNNAFVKTEYLAPYDLQGTLNGASAPFDTRQLSDGTHTLEATIQLQFGTTLTVVDQFSVQNANP